MKVSLKELNDSYKSLLTVGESVTGGKMKYRLSRLIKSAKEAVEAMGEALAGLAEKHGAEMLGGNHFKFADGDQDRIKAFNKEADEFLKTEIVELWGDTQYFPFSELEKAEDEKKKVSAAVLADLLWLFSDDTENQKEEKAAVANA